MPNGDQSGLGQATAAAPAACGNNDVGGGAAGCGAALAPPVVPAHDILGVGDDPPGPVADPVGPVINVAKPYVLVHKTYLPDDKAVRVKVHLTTDAAFDGTGTLRIDTPQDSTASVAFYDVEHGGNLVFDTTSNDFPGDDLTIGIDLWAQGVSPSAAMKDITLDLSLSGGTKPIKDPVQGTLTAVEVTMDLCMSRAVLGADPAPLSDDDKINAGRFVHVQKAQHHGRALLRVHKAQPQDFPGTLVLLRDNAKVKIFNDEVPAAGQAAIALPHNLPNGGIPDEGQAFWVEGATVSGALIDSGFKLGVQGLTKQDGDWAKVTVVELRNMSLSGESTPPHTLRAGGMKNGPVPRYLLKGGSAPKHYSDDFKENRPVVMLEHSTDDLQLSVEVRPKGVPVYWASIERARKSGTPDFVDHAQIASESTPGIGSGGGLLASMDTDGVGSFHVRAYVNCNDIESWQGDDSSTGSRIDREPFIVMNLVLVRVKLFANECLANRGHFAAVAAGGGIGVAGGTWGPPGENALQFQAKIDVVGGGPEGKLGLDRVFAGWVNNVAEPIDWAGRFDDTTVVPTRRHHSAIVIASNMGAASVASPGFANVAQFLPGAVAPDPLDLPILDTGRNPGGGNGGDTATLGRSRFRKSGNLSPDPGERWLVTAIDSPGTGEAATHPGFPAAHLVRFRFGLDFNAGLCLWTNIGGDSGASSLPASRLYQVVLRFRWKMRGEWSINAAGAVAVISTPRVSIEDEVIYDPAEKVENTEHEIRFPSALAHLAQDYRN